MLFAPPGFLFYASSSAGTSPSWSSITPLAIARTTVSPKGSFSVSSPYVTTIGNSGLSLSGANSTFATLKPHWLFCFHQLVMSRRIFGLMVGVWGFSLPRCFFVAGGRPALTRLGWLTRAARSPHMVRGDHQTRMKT